MVERTSDDAEYEPLQLNQDGENEIEDLDFLRPEKDYGLSRNRKYKVLFYIAAVVVIFFAILSAFLIFRLLVLQAVIKEADRGFPTDFKDAQRSIAYEQVVFTGDFKLNKSSREVYHHVPEGQLRYFGDPEKYQEIDKNWQTLLQCIVVLFMHEPGR
jgi:hypothetical protein